MGGQCSRRTRAQKRSWRSPSLRSRRRSARRVPHSLSITSSPNSTRALCSLSLSSHELNSLLDDIIAEEEEGGEEEAAPARGGGGNVDEDDDFAPSGAESGSYVSSDSGEDDYSGSDDDDDDSDGGSDDGTISRKRKEFGFELENELSFVSL